MTLRHVLCGACVMAVVVGAIDVSAQQPRTVPRPQAPARPAVRPLTPELTAWRAADRAIAAGKYADAEAAVAALGADHAVALAVRGQIATLKGQYREAEDLLTRSAKADITGEGALELGLLLQRLSRKGEAERYLKPIYNSASASAFPLELVRAARAGAALGNFRQANSYLRAAAGPGGDDPAVQTAWGNLFLEKYNRQEATRSYQLALKIDSSYVPAMVGLARAMASDNPPQASALAKKALSINEASEPAHLLLAEIAMDDSRRDEAKGSVAKALAINPSSLEARSMLAAIAWLEERQADVQAEVARILAISPKYGDVYRVLGDHAARAYRFDDAAALVRRGLELEPDNSRARASLGSHLLRTGDEAGARAALDEAFKVDPFDVVTYNSLSLLDTLDKFETFKEGDISLRLDPGEAGVLRHYAMPLAQEALATLAKKYGFTPKGPILVEIFPRHDDFAVRTLGLPGMIGALGACFGRVVTMDSPKARPPGFFSWRATLWHELAHVITLQMSAQRVPRWLTEGTSVYEERAANDAWGRESEMTFLRLWIDGKAIPLKELNAGFQDPEKISIAYFQASLLVEHLIARFGMDGFKKLVTAFSTATEPDGPVKASLGMSLAELQPSFDQYLEQRYGKLRAPLTRPKGVPEITAKAGAELVTRLVREHESNYVVQLEGAQALVELGQLEPARAALQRAVALVPLPGATAPAHQGLAAIANKQGDKAREMAELHATVEADPNAIESARRLAELAREAQDTPRTQAAAERIMAVDPFDPLPHSLLGRLALTRKDTALALREFQVALDAGPSDLAGAHTDIAEAHLQRGDPSAAKQAAIAALEVAPRYERAQELLLSVVDAPANRERR